MPAEIPERPAAPYVACKMIKPAHGAERCVASDLRTALGDRRHCVERKWIPGVS